MRCAVLSVLPDIVDIAVYKCLVVMYFNTFLECTIVPMLQGMSCVVQPLLKKAESADDGDSSDVPCQMQQLLTDPEMHAAAPAAEAKMSNNSTLDGLLVSKVQITGYAEYKEHSITFVFSVLLVPWHDLEQFWHVVL